MEIAPVNIPVTGQKCAYSIQEISASLGVSRGVIVKEIARGRLRAKRIGRRLVVMHDQLKQYLEDAEAVKANVGDDASQKSA